MCRVYLSIWTAHCFIFSFSFTFQKNDRHVYAPFRHVRTTHSPHSHNTLCIHFTSTQLQHIRLSMSFNAFPTQNESHCFLFFLRPAGAEDGSWVVTNPLKNEGRSFPANQNEKNESYNHFHCSVYFKCNFFKKRKLLFLLEGKDLLFLRVPSFGNHNNQNENTKTGLSFLLPPWSRPVLLLFLTIKTTSPRSRENCLPVFQ